MAKAISFPVHERYPPPEAVRRHAAVASREAYEELWRQSVHDREAFWGDLARRYVDWIAPFGRVVDEDLRAGRIRWFEGGRLNVAANCLDRHLRDRGDQVAILWEGDEPGTNRSLTYGELYEGTCRMASALRARGIAKGDRVAIYMGMVPELAVAMLACARIGAIHSVIFGGFSPRSIADRIADVGARAVLTQDEGRRGGKAIPLKANIDAALLSTDVDLVIVYRHTGSDVAMKRGRDVWWHDIVPAAPAEAFAEPMDAEDPLFVLYTSGSTGKPKGVLHTQAGYLVHVMASHRLVFDLRAGDVYCCAADVGWITGHSYIVYGPLANGATTVMFESIPTYPDAGRYWDMVDRLGITQFYTAPTAIRTLMRAGDDLVRRHRRSSLRILGTVGEPINPEAWRWYHQVVGEGRCAVVDTYWQTETGGHVITGLPGALDMKPGSASLPFLGVRPCLVDEQGREIEGPDVSGRLCISQSWPGMMRTVYGDHDRFVETYLVQVPGKYLTGDGAHRDSDGYYWLTGRIDDVLNVAGHRIGTAEVEGALVANRATAEAAVVGFAHETKGEGIFAFVVLKASHPPSAELARSLRQTVREELSPIAIPDRIQFVDGLPKTRSGKIMRRILRKVAEGDIGNVGDVTTLADPSVVQVIVDGAQGTF